MNKSPNLIPPVDLTRMNDARLCSASVQAYYAEKGTQFESPDVVRGFTDALNFVMGIESAVDGFGVVPKDKAQSTRHEVIRRIVERYAYVDPGDTNG